MGECVEMGTLRWSDIETEAERQAFSNFFIQSDIKFSRNSAGEFEAIVRMVPPGFDLEVHAERDRLRSLHSPLTHSLPPYPSPLSASQSSVQPRAAVADDRAHGRGSSRPGESYGFPKLESLLAPSGTSSSGRRPLSWLMRVMEDIYDARFAHDSAEFQTDDSGAEVARPGRMSDIFPVFCFDHLSKKYGLRSLVDRTAHELLRAVADRRGDHLEIQIFARFLEEFYDPDDLLFFLYVRSVIQKESGINFRVRWTEGAGRSPRDALWLSYRACQLVSRTVFMSERDPLYKAFMRTVDEHLIGELTMKKDTRRIEVATFLQLALKEYHECRPVEGQEPPQPAQESTKQRTSTAPRERAPDQDKLYRDAERQYEQAQRAQQLAAAAAPLPTGDDDDLVVGRTKPRVHVNRHGSISIKMSGGGGGGGGGRGDVPSENFVEAPAQGDLQRDIDSMLARRGMTYTEALLSKTCSSLPNEVVVEIRCVG